MKVEFRFPFPSGAFYDHESRMAYIWGSIEADELISSISHENIHDILTKKLGKKISCSLDKIAEKVKSWDEIIYYTLY